MNTLLSILSLLFILTSCDFLVSPDKPKDIKIQLSDVNKNGTYTRIVAGGESDIVIKKGDKCKVSLSGNDKHFKYIILDINGNTLTTQTLDGGPSRLNVKIHVTLPKIEKIKLSGAGEIEMWHFGTLENLEINLSGAGSFTTSGKPTKLKYLDLSISGAGSIDAENLRAEKVDVSVSGAGSADVYASKSLDASVSGVGSIDYIGNPKVKKNVSGIGSIGRK